MFTQLKHFRREYEFTQKRWVYLEDAETPATSQENLAEKTPTELMEMLRQEGADLEEKKEIVRSLIGKLEQSTIPETLKKSIRDEVSDVLTTMETEENALEIHRLRFELAGTIKAEGMSDVAEWWEKIKIVSPTKNAIIATFKSLKEMDWKEMLDGGLDKLMEYGGMIISFISGGKLGKSAPVTPEKKSPESPEAPESPEEPKVVETPKTPEVAEKPAEKVVEQVQGLRNIQELRVTGREMAFKTVVDGKSVEWRINPDGRRLLRKQEDGNISTPEGNFREIVWEPSLTFFTEYLANHHKDLMDIAINIKENGQATGVLSTRILVALIKLQQMEDEKVGEKIDVLTTLNQNFSREEQKSIFDMSGSDPQKILNAIREKKNK
jgi:hypothetical protein